MDRQEVLPWVIVAVQDLADTWSDRLTSMSNYLRDARQFIGDAVDGIAGFFTGLRDTVSEVWDKVVSTIAKAIGAIGDMMKRVEWVPGAGSIRNLGNNLVTWAKANGYADGGYITGPGGPRDDLVPAWLSNGEYVVNAAATEQNLPLLEAINSGNVPRFADGGRVALDRGIAQAQQYHGQAYDYGGYTGGVDCSLLASKITAALLGLDTGTRLFNTESDFEAMGWRPGLDLDGWSVGIFRGGGGPNSHMAGTLGGVPVESSGSGVFYGPPAAGADDPQFDLHYYLPREMWNPPDPGPGSASAPAEYDPNVPEGPTGAPRSYLSGGSAGYSTLPDYESAFTPPGSGEGGGDMPATISGLFGDAAKAFVEGQLTDAFDVIGLPDKVPRSCSSVSVWSRASTGLRRKAPATVSHRRASRTCRRPRSRIRSPVASGRPGIRASRRRRSRRRHRTRPRSATSTTRPVVSSSGAAPSTASCVRCRCPPRGRI
ncbi:hypothetical protein [Rhodococcus aetherivorans]|uniref:hypothetical protein n=1 Tax=Rhodococcus aetherivorans TaxID=191292 RepID=UPI003890C3F0